MAVDPSVKERTLMFIAFPTDVCNQHSILTAALLTLLILPACKPAPVAAILEARPSGSYGEELSWTSTQSSNARHRVDVEIEIDAAQLLGWAKTTFSYSAFIDISVQGGGNVDEQWKNFKITEERVLGEDEGVIKIAYLAAGDLQESGFRKPASQRALTFKARGEDVTLVAHIRTPQGADRKILRAIRMVRLIVRSGSDDALTGWVEQPRTTRK